MKKMLKRPVVESAFSSSLVVQDAGRAISNAPKNDTAKTTRSKKKMMLKTALVERLLSADAPKIPVISNPSNT